jgi:hypothetical protein
MEPTEGSETSAFKIQTPGKYPKEYLPHLQHGESLKTKLLTSALKLAECRPENFQIETKYIQNNTISHIHKSLVNVFLHFFFLFLLWNVA